MKGMFFNVSIFGGVTADYFVSFFDVNKSSSATSLSPSSSASSYTSLLKEDVSVEEVPEEGNKDDVEEVVWVKIPLVLMVI